MMAMLRDLQKQIDQAVIDYRDGATLMHLAEAYGVSYGTARNWMLRRGVELRSRGVQVADAETMQKRIKSRIIIDPVTNCWIWQGAQSDKTYGSIYYEGGMKKTHVVSYKLFKGDYDKDLDLDHKCRNTLCCNPDHLDPVTRSENLKRSLLMDRKSQNTHCSNGHEYSGDNLRLTKKGHRVCKTCMAIHLRAWRQRQKESACGQE